MGDKGTRIGGIAGSCAKRHLPGRQRANHAEPGLKNDDAYCGQVQDTKPGVSHPGPIEWLANENKGQAGDHEQDENNVAEKKRISRQEEKRDRFHASPLACGNSGPADPKGPDGQGTGYD